MARKIQERFNDDGVKCICIVTKKRGSKWISRDDIIETMNGLICETEGQRSKNYHGIYAIYPTKDSDKSELWKAENCGQYYGVKKIFEKLLGDDNFNTGQGVNWLWHLDIAIGPDPIIAIPRKEPRI